MPNADRFVFGTKGQTLERLRHRIQSAQVLPLLVFTTQEWKKNRGAVLHSLRKSGFADGAMIVRSSAQGEDGGGQSMAGQFRTVTGVRGETQCIEAICQVIASYARDNGEDQVLVQPELQAISMAGVAFSVDPNLLSPYRVINFEEESGGASAVTSGAQVALRTFVCAHGQESKLPPALHPIARLIVELEELTGETALDIEFAVSQGHLFLLQCRPLVVAAEPLSASKILAALATTADKIDELSKPHPYLLGKTTLFGVMPDWNPAEIIGLKPRPLALTLYRELITSGIWAYQRDNYGYRNLRSFPLLVDFWGLPYIDVRVSFNSFIPKTLDDALGAKLVDFYLQALAEAPTLHDKVEFEIALTCYTLDIQKRLAGLRAAGFTDEECTTIESALRDLTDNIIHHNTGLWRKDIGKIAELEKRIPQILSSGLDDLSRLYWLLEDCKRYGTLPFAGLARAGFIAVQMLRSLVTEKVITQEDYDRFFRSLDTVSSRMCRDFHLLEKDVFLEFYGHLRPGTYDLLSPRYDREPDRYFDWSTRDPKQVKDQTPFSLELNKLIKLESALKAHGLHYSALDFLDFIRAAIEGREYSKFVFTHSLSEALSLVEQIGAAHGLDSEALSFVDIHSLQQLHSSAGDVGGVLRNAIAEGRKRFAITRALRLPPLIAASDSITCFELPTSQPNFVTRKRVSGTVLRLERDSASLDGAIVFIPSADPGYDWIFSKNISGLVTMFGGANSHMAIRAGELGIAAVIGAGESLYQAWGDSESVEIDCENQKVQTLR